ncbi:MAG: serine hydrolase domain-containing protein [Pseudomonadales bacterium]
MLRAGAAVIGWILAACIGGLFGWWLTPVVEAGDTAAFSAWARARTEQENPGASAIVLIENGQAVHQYYSAGVDADTLFPAASMSKFFAGLAVMALVDEGKLDLDEPVSNYLTRWQLPESQFGHNQVTVRRLLSHTSGLTDGLGFGDYLADEELPTLEASLSNPRASSNEPVHIQVGQAPGEFLYSGGGYLILELVVEEVSGQTFAEFVGERIFTPMGMQRSTYQYLGDQDNRAESFYPDGSVAPTYQYASNAATALATSAADLTELVMRLNRDVAERIRAPEAMAFGFPIYGLGSFLFAPTSSGDFIFGHDGGNTPAINTSLRINPENWDAFIMLESGHPSLASDIAAEWVLWQTGYPDFRSTGRALLSALLPAGMGSLLIILLGVAAFRTSRPRG